MELIWPAVIISMVRRLFFVLMIIMLPLRGWVGDAMAMQMALVGTTQPIAIVQGMGAAHHDEASTAAHPHALAPPPAVAHGDCTDHGASDDPTQDTHCQTCTVCQACHAVAITLPPLDVATLASIPLPPQSAAGRFVSADRALGLKPPIS